MKSLDIPVPPQIEAAVGYSGEARWFSLWWTCCGDTVAIDDGRCCMAGHGRGFLAWIRHAAVARALVGLDLGSSDREGPDRLLIDRRSRTAFSAEAAEARAFLRRQRPASGMPLTSQDEFAEAMGRSLAGLSPPPSPAEVAAAMRRHAEVVAAMLRWLDQVAATTGPKSD